MIVENRTGDLCGPRLRPCEGCGGMADYARVDVPPIMGNMIVARCSRCGRQTGPYVYADSAAKAWNRRITTGARVVTLDELSDIQWGMGDDADDVAVWIEGEGGSLRCAVLSFGIDLGDLTVHEYGNGRSFAWSPRDIRAEGVNYRIWDKKPEKWERERAPWVGGPAWKEAREARAEAAAEAMVSGETSSVSAEGAATFPKGEGFGEALGNE